jgi:hypothetical protein
MLLQQVNEICEAAFINLVKMDSQYHGRTYCYLAPYESRTGAQHITLVDKATGFGVVVPLKLSNIPFLDKDMIQKIMAKVFSVLVKTAEQKKHEGKPVDYKNFPISAKGHKCRLDHIESNANVTVEIYSWSKLILSK